MKNNGAKRERFVRIIERRVDKLLDDLEKLSKCSNRLNYEYSEVDVNKVFNTIEGKLKDTKILFQSSSKKRKKFKLEGNG